MADLFGKLSTLAQSDLDFPVSLTERYRPHSISDFVGLQKPRALTGAEYGQKGRQHF